jgi:hypothetical protein
MVRGWLRMGGERVGGETVPLSSTREIGPELRELYARAHGPEVAPLPMPERLRWIEEGLENRRLLAIYFRREGRLVGWSLLRIGSTRLARDAMIVEMFTSLPEPSALSWMVAETVAHAAAHGARRIRALTSSPRLKAALRRNLFLQRSSRPVHLWPSVNPLAPGPFHVGFDTGDAPLLPYPPAGDPSQDGGR